MWLRILWLLLVLAAFTNATALASETDDEDVSIEEPSHPKQPFYDSNYDADDYYYRDKYQKPTISEDAIFLPHEKYCQYFYAFDGRESYIFRCPSGYRFDAEKLQCLKTKEVRCGKRKKDTDSSEEKHVGNNFKCPKWSGAHPHNHYCHLFYYCQNKKPSLFMCPPGKLFDKKINGCLPQNQVKCEKRENPYEDDDPEDISLPDPDSNTQYQCPDKAGVYPDPQYCHKYIRCWYGLGELYVCPKGKLYDEDLKSCRSKNSVYCYDKINPYVIKDDEEPTVIDEYPNFQCRANFGRFPHEECSQFYQCEGGYARLFKCPNEKMFDSDSGLCKIASEVTCNKETKDEDNDDEFVCPAREGIFKDEEDCGSYYKCKKGKAQRLQCPEGELFDTDWKSCSNENEVTCGDRPLPGDDQTSDNEEESIIDENPKYNCEKRHGRFTHQDYCTWFYHCKDGRPSVRSCKGGKYYDSYRRNCYDEVDCGSRKPKPDYEITTPKPREFSCPAKSGKFVDPRDCGAYYVCEKYKHKLHQCPKGKLFHDKWLVCSDERLVDCGNRAHPDVDPEDRENKVIDPNPKFECKAKYGQYDHEEYCDWYYNCHDSKATLRECRRGKYYDSHRRKCYQSKDVSCGRRRKPEERDNPTTTEKTITTKRPEFRCPQEKGKFPHWRDCSKFYECKKWTHKEHKCPKHKLFDSRRQSCEDDDYVICDERIHPDMDPDEPEDKVVDPNPRFSCKSNYGRFTNDEYCHWYYNCHNKKATVRECRHGRYYDSRRRKCYDSKEVSCEGRKKPDDDWNFKTTTEDYITTAPNFECPKGEGKYPHERDCGKFYECKQWRYKVHNCPKHQLFNEKPKKCEPEEKVTCGNRIHPEDDPDEPEDKIVDPNPDFNCPSSFGRYDHRNCDYYYHCRDRRPSVRECRRGKYYDRYSRKCKDSIDVDCKDRIRPEDRVTYKPEKSTTISEQTSTTTKDKTTTMKRPITEDSTTENDRITTTTTHPEENTGRTESRKSTAKSTTVSSINTETSVSTPNETPKPEISTKTTEEPTTELDDNPDKIIDREPSYDCAGDEGDFAHESYCHYYYSCQKNKVTLRECPEGKYFDVDRGYCEDWYMVSCGDRLTPEELGSTFDEFQSTPYIERRRTTIIRERTTTEEPVSVKPKFDCPSDGTYPHERNCEKYYLCVNGVAEEKLCPKKQLYDVEKKACNEEQETNCGKRIHPNDDPDDKIVDPNPDFNCTDRHGCMTHEKFCKWYYYCHDKRPEVRECSGDRYFDSTRNKCLEWWMVFCDDRIVPEETTIMPTTATSITSSRNTLGPSEENTEDTSVTDSGSTTREDQHTKSTTDNQDTDATNSDTEETEVTGSTNSRTRSTGDDIGTFSTADEDQGTESTSSDSVFSSTRERTSTTDNGKITRSTREGNQGTGSTKGQTSTTENGRGTRSTREGDQGKSSTSSGRVTGSTEGRTRTTGSDIRTRSTGSEDYGTGSTSSGRVTDSTGESTTDNGRGTRSTRYREGTTSSGRVTGSTGGRTRTTGRDIGTRSTDSGDQGTGSTNDGRGTRSTRYREGTTSSGRVTGSTGGRTRTTDRDIGTRSTGSEDYGTGSTSSGRVTDSTGESATDNGRGTRSTRYREGTTSSGRVTGSTGGRTRTTGRDIGTRSTDSGDQGTGSTNDGRGTRSTRYREGTTSSGRVTGSTGGRTRTTDRDIGTRSTGSEDYGTGSTSSGRVTDSTGESTTDNVRGTGSTRYREGTTSSGRVTDSTGGRTRTTGRDIGTRSTDSGDQGTGSTDNGRGTRSTRYREATTSSGRITGSTGGRTRTTGRDIGTRSTGSEDYGTGSTSSGRVTDSTGESTTDNGRGTRSTRYREGTTSSGRVTGSTGGRTRTTGRDIGTRSTDSGDQGTGSTDNGRETRSTRYREGTTSSGRITGSTGGRTRTTGRDIGTRSTDSGDQGTGSTNDGRGTRSTRYREGTTSSGRVTGSTGGRTRTTGRDIGTRSTGSGDHSTDFTSSDRVTDSTSESTTDNGRGTRSTRDRESSTASGRVTGSTEERTRTTGRDIGTRSTVEGDRDRTTGIFTTPSDIADKCKEEDGDFDHPDDCSKYITCKDGEYSINDCPSGMLFDKILRICDREERVDCDGRKKPEVTTDDCDEWLRTSTTADNPTTQTRKGTTGTTNKGTGGTETTSSGTKEEASTTSSPSTGSTSKYISDGTNEYTESDSSNPSGSSIATEPTNSGSVSENFSDRTPTNEISSETGITGDDNVITTEENSSKEPTEETGETMSTNSKTGETTEISEIETGVTDATISTDDDRGKTGTTFTTKDNESEDSTITTVIIIDPTVSTTSESEENTDSSDTPTSTNDDTKTKSTDTTNDNESGESTIKTVTDLKPTVSTDSESGENTDSTSEESGTSTKTASTDNSKETTQTISTSDMDPTTDNKSTTKDETTENTNSSESEPTTDDQSKTEDSTAESTYTPEREPTNDNVRSTGEGEETSTDPTSKSTISETTNDGTTEDETLETRIIGERTSPEPTTDDENKTEDSTAESTYTSERESTNDNVRSTGEETSTNPSDKSTISETTNDGTTEDETLETRIISERTPPEPETSTLTSTQGTENSISTSEVSSSTENLSTDDDNRTGNPSTTESQTNDSSTDDLKTEPNTDDKVSEVTSTITTAKDVETTSKPTTTTSNEGGSTDSETETTEHTTMHPCLTHTHPTALPTEPTKIDCDNDDIDCIERETGNIEKWYRCPRKQGHFPHPHSNRIFIRCRDWKPKVKKCSRKQIFSEKHMRCIHLVH